MIRNTLDNVEERELIAVQGGGILSDIAILILFEAGEIIAGYKQGVDENGAPVAQDNHTVFHDLK